MPRTKPVLLTVGAAACLIAGAAFGGSLLGAGAATSGSSGAPTTAPQGGTFPNEDKSHEAGESAGREQSEHNGTAGPGPGGPPDGQFRPNEDRTHEGGESAGREQSEHNGSAAPTPPSSGSAGPSQGT
jgi:hypothetical protein